MPGAPRVSKEAADKAWIVELRVRRGQLHCIWNIASLAGIPDRQLLKSRLEIAVDLWHRSSGQSE